MSGNERGHVSVPTAQQNCRTSIVGLRQTEPTILLRHLDSKRADLRESLEIFRRNFTSAIDLVRIHMFTQVVFDLAQEIFARGTIFRTLRGIRIDSIEIVTPDEKIAGKTAAVLERIARCFCQLERFALPFRHLRRVDDSDRRGLFGLRACLFSNLFLRRFEGGFHIIRLSFRAKSRKLWTCFGKIRGVSTSLDMTEKEVRSRVILRKISSHPWRASSGSHMAKISLRFAPVVRVRRQFFSVRSAPRNATVRHGMARNRFPKSFHSRRPPANRRLSPLRIARLRSPSGGQAAARVPQL